MIIRVQEADFDVGVEVKQVHQGNYGVGAVCSFVGLVRDFQESAEEGRDINSLTLEHYPQMTEKKLTEIAEEAKKRWSLEAITIIHRYGRLELGDQIVLVIAASAHRQASFEACHFMMDYLKTQAPFWKLEENTDGEGQWVDAREEDQDAHDKW